MAEWEHFGSATCQQVALERQRGIPDSMIALELGVDVETLRRNCPDLPGDPLGLGWRGHPDPRPKNPNPHGHDSAPLDLTPRPYSNPPASSDAGGAALLLLLLLLD